MPDFLSGWPFWVVFAFLYAGATLRGQSIYWLGRWATHLTVNHTRPTKGWQLRAHGWLSGEGPQRGIDALRRWGLVMVPLGYLTVGFQSMIMAGAGILRIAWWKFSLAQIPGSLAWAAIYSTIGFAVWGAVIAAAAGSPLGIAVIVAVVVLLVATFVAHRLRRRTATPTTGATLETEAGTVVSAPAARTETTALDGAVASTPATRNQTTDLDGAEAVVDVDENAAAS
ncbi:DedA family protein [Georgenia sp. Z1491]|uniref:DedA family protein n=1 Tax=Georgenia sp. Z1491 TaxID=3416707 RepID=UPI003CF7DD56